MSCIEKMVIQGIRSFGPNDDDKQMIKFFTPLTLILGPNGTGKTTIIECLKYITTGDMPPGATKNAAFIHDPKVIDETEVKAQIRLMFRSVQGQVYSVTRSIKAVQKAKNIQMTTLEGVITRKDRETGKPISISSRCAEMDKEMVSLLGVAKPILDSVIFCHQEEANWPLSEGKALKARFDDIFASTRYVKALECLLKTAKAQDVEIKLYKNDLKFLKQNKDKANQLKADIEEKTGRYEAACEAIENIQQKMQPVVNQLDKIQSQGNEIHKIQTEIEKMETEQKQIEKSQQELRANIKNMFQGSASELEQALHNFESELQEKESMLEQYRDNVKRLDDKLDEISEQKAALLVELGVLKEEAQRYKQNIQARNDIITELRQKYHITGFTGNLSDKQVTEFVKTLDRKQQSMKEELLQKRVDYEKKEADIQSEIDDLRKRHTVLETELTMKTERKSKNQSEIKEIIQKLYSMEASPEHLTRISTELKSLEMDLKEAEANLNTELLQEEIKNLSSDKSGLESKLKKFDDELNLLTRESSVRSRITHLKNDRTSKHDSCQKLKASAGDSLTHLLGCVPTDNLRKRLDQFLSKLTQQRRKANEQLQKLKQEKTEKETQRKMVREQLRKKEEEIRNYQDQLNTVSGSENFDEGLEKLQSDLKKAQDEKGNLKGVQYMYKKYQETLRREDPPCPLCHRPFDNQSEVEELIAELEKKMSLVPDKLERVCSKIDKNKKKVEELIELKPIKVAMMRLESEELPKYKQEIESLRKQIETLEQQINDKEDEVDALVNDEQMAQNIQGDVCMIDKLHTDIEMMDKEIRQLSSKLSTTDQSRSIQDVQEDRSSLQEQIELVSRKLERKQKKLNEQTDYINKLHASINEKNSEVIEIEKNLQQKTTLEDKKAALEEQNTKLEQEIKEGKIELRPLHGDIKEKEKEKQEFVRRKEDEINKGNRQINKISEEVQNVSQFNRAIESYISEGKDRRIEVKESEITKTEQKASKLSEKRAQLASEIDNMKDDLSMQQLRKREMSDNLMLLEKEDYLAKLEKRCCELKEQLGGLDVKNLRVQKEKFEQEYNKFLQEKRQAETRKSRHMEAMDILKRELEDDIYKDADKKYREKNIDLVTTEQAKQDLMKYYKALDRTIMSYHKSKMNEINEIIRELWVNTYKGNDIETIEIRSDEEEAVGGTARRRTFNYRVVMIKNGIALDMKNRCSAGQKVLASIIIRLALAECFCIRCGVLALDEPTTNLDRENIESLAQALVEIIKVRSNQRNFQLIIITHDEDFVELLGRSEYVEEFFKVRKNKHGYSQLVKARVEDLYSR